MANLVDAPDSKAGIHWVWGFDSPSRYHRSHDFVARDLADVRVERARSGLGVSIIFNLMVLNANGRSDVGLGCDVKSLADADVVVPQSAEQTEVHGTAVDNGIFVAFDAFTWSIKTPDQRSPSMSVALRRHTSTRRPAFDITIATALPALLK